MRGATTGLELAGSAVLRDPFMTHTAESRGHDGVQGVGRRVLQAFSRRPDRRIDLRLCVEPVTGIDPAWPAWKAMTPVYRPSPPRGIVGQDEQEGTRTPGSAVGMDHHGGGLGSSAAASSPSGGWAVAATSARYRVSGWPCPSIRRLRSRVSCPRARAGSAAVEDTDALLLAPQQLVGWSVFALA